MVSEHEAVAIAQIAFYAPIVPLTWYLFWRNGRVRPRMAWWPLITFSLFRLVGGILVVILAGQPDNVGITIAALIFLNVGLIPLLFSTVGLVRKCLMDSFPDERHPLRTAIKLIRIVLIAPVILLASSGGLSSSDPNTGRTLAIAGYVIFLVAAVVLAAFQIYLRMRTSTLTSVGRTIITYSVLATPFIIVRAVYGVLYTLNSSDLFSYWSPLYGNAVVFAIMALLMEYIALLIYIAIGLVIPPSRGGQAQAVEEEELTGRGKGRRAEHV